jgi:hypothetical protein
MFEELFHKITFGIFRKKDDPAAAKVDVQAAAQGKAQVLGKAQGLESVGDSTEDPALAAPAAPVAVVGNDTPGLQSSTPGVGQGGGGRRRRRGSRGSRGSRSKSKRGGFTEGPMGHHAMGFGRAGGSGHRRSKKRNTHKRRK